VDLQGIDWLPQGQKETVMPDDGNGETPVLEARRQHAA